MDAFTFVSTAPITRSIELYTGRYFVKGDISGPFKRTSDYLNHKENHYVKVNQATMTSLGGQVTSRVMSTPLLMSKDRLHLVADVHQGSGFQQQRRETTESTANSHTEFHVQKTTFPCYVMTDTFHIQGHCYLRRDTDLLTLLELGETFLPITDCTITLVGNTNASWQREFVLVNKGQIEAIYASDT